LLDQVDFGFIHEVLFFSREHAGSITTTVAEVRQTLIREWLFLLQDYGLRYFTRAELDELEEKHLRRWYRLLVRGAITGRGRDYLNFHLAGLREARGRPMPAASVAPWRQSWRTRSCIRKRSTGICSPCRGRRRAGIP